MAQLSSDGFKTGADADAINNKESAINVSGIVMDATDPKTKGHAMLLRKLDWHIVPIITLLYLFSFLDRVNLGNAKIAGMATDLHLVGLRYNAAAAVFFVTYGFGQVPSNVILKFFRPSLWSTVFFFPAWFQMLIHDYLPIHDAVPMTMVAWGLITTLTCLVKTYSQLLVVRTLLGLAEAGILPGVIYYISMWYPRADRAKRIAMIASAATLAGAFGGILAYAIEKMDGIGRLHGWQWIFCLEGIATVVVALAVPFFMCDHPEAAPFLTDDERRCLVELMKTDSQGLATYFDFKFVMQGLGDLKIYLQFIILIGITGPIHALAPFIPTIINKLGYSTAHAQLLSVAPHAAGCVVTILVGIDSDRRQLRGPYVFAGIFLSMLGCIIMYTQARPSIALVGIVLASIGLSSSVPVALTWTSSNAGGDVKRAVAIAMVNGLANIGGVFASFIFFDPPRFHVGLGICLGLLGCSMLTCLFMMWHYDGINKERERYCREHGITEEDKDEFSEKGDDSPLFRYGL